ncbi:MAG: small multi-drug export protein [Treponema sp.]|nr:small multi-drug export protein [Treponema sp.]
MDSIVQWFTNTLGQYISAEFVVFIISALPILECRGGLLASSLLQIPILKAIPICVFGNILPIPFIILFIKKIFQWLKKINFCKKLIEKTEERAIKKSDKVSKGEFWGLLIFVGIPLPYTGAWTGSLIASLLEMDIKKAILACFLGVLLATIIMSFLSYGLLGLFI